MADVHQESIFVEIDALLDTRLGAFFQHDTKMAEEIITEGYQNREYNHWKACSYKKYERIYKKRNKTTLANSAPTPIIEFINDYVKEKLLSKIDSPSEIDSRMYINIHGYHLNKDEKKQLLMIMMRLTLIGNIKIVSKEHKKVTPEYLSRNKIGTLIVYNYEEWLLAQEFVKGNSPVLTGHWLTVIAPSIFNGDGKELDEDLVRIKQIEKEASHKSITEELYGEVIDLKLIDSSNFSISRL